MSITIYETEPDGSLCANRWYLLIESDTCLDYEWRVISTPPAANNSGVEFSSVNGKTTYVRVPIDGSYCFTVNKSKA